MKFETILNLEMYFKTWNHSGNAHYLEKDDEQKVFEDVPIKKRHMLSVSVSQLLANTSKMNMDW